VWELKGQSRAVSRRVFLRAVGVTFALKGFFFGAKASGQVVTSGLPLPEEKIEATLKRLFGNRPLSPGDGKIKLELPLIAEDGGNVPITVESSLAMTPGVFVKSIYIVSDKNRRPMIAKFSFSPEVGTGYIATSIRLAANTDVRAVVEMNDGTLYAVNKHVRVVMSGCGDVPQS
jgi:predicted secreted protein